ncbi:MAG: carbamoyltransferase HypF [Candidatus Dormiibacterota bacterium]
MSLEPSRGVAARPGSGGAARDAMSVAAVTDAPGSRERMGFTVRGVVQGVGFRPFVWNLATRLGLSGEVCNTSGALVIEVEGDPWALQAFAVALRRDAPRLARIDAIDERALHLEPDEGFRIVESRPVEGDYQPIAPDAATCPECVADIGDPGNRRHRYPFTNCTNCGPRFTIIEDLPYDRPLTSMRHFTMCDACRHEYEDPADRRFHAQPNACPACGPRLWCADPRGNELHGDPIELAASAIARGEIVALKGLGGFQLCCDATNTAAVTRLRQRKHRPSKPFAVMYPDVTAVRRQCIVTDPETALLEGSIRPIVLLRRRRDRESCVISDSVAPGLGEVGVMLPYTPMHHLLLRASGTILVVTSGNVSEEPIARENDEALRRLGRIADRFLLHDRDIAARYDDSVVRVVDGTAHLIRRARGYCPLPVRVESPGGPVLALGAHLKNTFCVLRGGNAFTGPHIGDLDTPLALDNHDEALRAYLRLFRTEPVTVAADAHPDYASTRIAERWWSSGKHAVRVQHHHAHIASVLAEHGLRGPVLGVAFDGVGLGPDNAIWGGEFLICDERSYLRAGHLAPVRQPGGDVCAREGWRMAIAYLTAAGELGEEPPHWFDETHGAPDQRRWRLVSRLARSEAAPITTSAGRMFDAVASLLGVAHLSTFEAEAAMRLEALAASCGDLSTVDHVDIGLDGDPMVLDTVHLVRMLFLERQRGGDPRVLAAMFHESLARGIVKTCHRISGDHGVTRIALSGGVFQNSLLLSRVARMLRERGLVVYTNHEVPANDGGISLGQALVAASREARG